LPVYATLAGRFCIADRWFASLPTDTWPNRLYALAGTSDGNKDTPSGSGVIDDPPGYTMTTMFEVLQDSGVDWGYFFSDLPFALVFKRLAQDATYTARMRGIDELVRRAHEGDLPAVTWVDPNFSDVPDDVSSANDDHPPGDMARGQRLVAQIYTALTTSPCWAKTLFVITYDEHGGFYDHVLPPGNQGEPGGPPDVGDFARYGLRVPTFVISPWVQPRSVTGQTYDHTSLIATIFRRFCTAPDGSVPTLGLRAASAADLGATLAANQPHLDAPPAPAAPNPVPVPVPVTDRESFGRVLRQALFTF
jgi:phospholipase C